jgi:predicted phage-related endonuclease
MKPEVQKIFTKLAKNEKEANVEKVDLNMVSNLKGDIERIEYKSEIVDKLINEFKQAASKLKNHYEAEFRGVIMDIEESQASAKRYVETIAQASKELGVDTSKIVNEYRSANTLGNKAITKADNQFRIISKL